jgi:hypothetical protein
MQRGDVRKIKVSEVGRELVRLIEEKDPDEEDIGVLDEDDNVLGVFISEPAYRFFLKKVEEAEDLLDLQIAAEFEDSGERQALEEKYHEERKKRGDG